MAPLLVARSAHNGAYLPVPQAHDTPYLELIRSFQTVSKKLDFSHLGARKIAWAKVSINAPGTFCGSLAHTNPQKLPTLKDRNHLHAAQAGGADAPTKRCHPENRNKCLTERPVSELCASFLAKMGVWRRCLELVPRRTELGDEHTTLPNLKWLKSS